MYSFPSGHLVSAADKDINHVGNPSCLIIANTSFFLVSRYAGEICNCLKTKYPSLCLTRLLTVSEHFISFAVYILPLVLHFLNAKWNLSVTCLISILFSLKNKFGTDCAASLSRLLNSHFAYLHMKHDLFSLHLVTFPSHRILLEMIRYSAVAS